jgi:nucleoid-associated protein YgaU
MEKTPKHHDSEEKKDKNLAPQKSGKVKTYVVKGGDTLSKIAEKMYGDANQYEKIYKANKELIGDDPNLIKVGQELTIPAK